MKEEDRKIGPEIHCTDLKLSRNLSAHVRKSGVDEVTMMHGWIIRYLYENREQDIFQKDIEQRFAVGRSTVTNLIQLMEKKGFVKREYTLSLHDALPMIGRASCRERMYCRGFRKLTRIIPAKRLAYNS